MAWHSFAWPADVSERGIYSAAGILKRGIHPDSSRIHPAASFPEMDSSPTWDGALGWQGPIPLGPILHRSPSRRPDPKLDDERRRYYRLSGVGKRVVRVEAQYGEPMAQLFRDQCHDAWASGRGWGLTVLWLRVLVDLAETSIKEHLGNLKQSIAMFRKVRLIVRDNPMARTTFRRLFAGVLVLAVGVSALLAFLMPKQYMSTAIVAVGHRTDNAVPMFYVTFADPDYRGCISRSLAAEDGYATWRRRRQIPSCFDRVPG